MTSLSASPMAARSAAMLIVFAMTNSAISANSSGDGSCRAKLAAKPLAGLPADPCADNLNRRHEWQREKHRPSERIAELRAGLQIGYNAARIVVRRAGNQSGSQ